MTCLQFSILLFGICVHLTSAAVSVSNCDGYTSPAGCTKGVNCDFEVSWRVFDAGAPTSSPNSNNTLAAAFTVTIRRATEKSSNFYSAIGFSEHQAMPDTDVVIGYAYNNNFLEVVDGFIEPGQIKAPVIDKQQDIFNHSGSVIGDSRDNTKRVLKFSFSRRLDTGDKLQDKSLALCQYFFFVSSGGTVGGPRIFYKHDLTPDMSSEKICLTKCKAGGGDSSAMRFNASWVFMMIPFIILAVLKKF